MEFRTLRPNEIEVRVGRVTQRGASLLLYKDARCDMAILDETVGALNWKRKHCRDNHNCIVSIWDENKEQWVTKEDVGTESNTEREKGLASDSFKRACVNWGIGRELYTSPRININCETVQKSNGHGYELKNQFEFFQCYVSEIGYQNRCISRLVIRDRNDRVIFTYGEEGGATVGERHDAMVKQVIKLAEEKKVSEETIAEKGKVKKIDDMPEGQLQACIRWLEGQK